MADRPDDFYIGYKPQAPAAVRDHVRKVVVALFALAVVVPWLLASSQGEFSSSDFEFGNVRPFEGRLAAEPYPILQVEEGADVRPHLLVELGKHGPRAELDQLGDTRVRVRGQLIHFDDLRMVELTADAPETLGAAPPVPGSTARTHGRVSLTGEILDSKCYLGVMKPGRGKAHRDCATRCLSGGVPPLFVATDRDGDQLHLLLVDESDRPIGPRLLDLVAEPVSVEGEVVARGGLLYLRAAASGFRRIGEGT